MKIFFKVLSENDLILPQEWEQTPIELNIQSAPLKSRIQDP